MSNMVGWWWTWVQRTFSFFSWLVFTQITVKKRDSIFFSISDYSSIHTSDFSFPMCTVKFVPNDFIINYCKFGNFHWTEGNSYKSGKLKVMKKYCHTCICNERMINSYLHVNGNTLNKLKLYLHRWYMLGLYVIGLYNEKSLIE